MEDKGRVQCIKSSGVDSRPEEATARPREWEPCSCRRKMRYMRG